MSAVDGRLTTATARANRLPVVALLTAHAISMVGNALTMVALPWFVLLTTGSAAKTGLSAFFFALPAFIAGVFGGPLVDRLGYRRASVIADVVSGLGVAAVPLLYHTVGLAFWQLLALVFLGALLDIPGFTARRAALPELTRLAGLRLEQTNAWFEAIQNLSMLVGPPLAGVLIVWLGASNVLWIDAATFAVSALIVGLAVPAMAVAASGARGGYLGDLGAGLRFLRRDRLLLTLAVNLTLSNFLTSGFYAVLLPVYAKQTFDRATVFGALIATSGAAALVGALAFGAVGHRLPRRALWIAAQLIMPIELWVLAALPPLPAIALGLVVSGLAAGPVNPLLVTVRHERIPPELRGRVFSTFSAIAQMAAPLGMLLVGNAIEGLGLRATVLGMAVAMQAIGVATFFVPALHELKERPADVLARERVAERTG